MTTLASLAGRLCLNRDVVTQSLLFRDVEYGISVYERPLCHNGAPCLLASHWVRHQGATAYCRPC